MLLGAAIQVVGRSKIHAAGTPIPSNHTPLARNLPLAPMKHLLTTSAAALALAATLCSAAPFGSDSANQLDTAPAVTLEAGLSAFASLQDDDQDESTISGKFYLHGMSGGYVYFSLDGVPVRMLEANFPNPIPPNGTPMTATGCTPDKDGGYTCTGLK